MLTLATASWVRRSAADAPPPRSEKVEEVVVTGTRTPERSQRATVKTDVVSRDEAERRGATNVAEALSTQPGVRVDPGAYGHLGGVGAIQIQGFDLQRVLVLEDGEPVVGERFRAELGYDYLFTRNDIADEPLGGRPPHTLTASVHSALLWDIAVDMRWRTSTDAFVSETLRAPGYTTIDLRVAREVWPRSQAYAGVLNVSDVHQVPGRVGDLRPPLGRVVYVGVRADWPGDEE